VTRSDWSGHFCGKNLLTEIGEREEPGFRLRVGGEQGGCYGSEVLFGLLDGAIAIKESAVQPNLRL